MYYYVLPYIAMDSDVLQCVTMYSPVLLCITMYCHVLPYIAMYYYVLQCISMSCQYDSSGVAREKAFFQMKIYFFEECNVLSGL